MSSSSRKELPSSPVRRTVIKALTASASSLALGSQALAQSADTYPSRPIKVLVNFPAGGVTDATFRKLADRFNALSKQQMVIENRPGRGVTSAALAIAPNDGYTLGLIGRGHMALHPILGGKLTYNPVTDFTWIAGLTSSWFGLFVPANSPIKTVADIVAAAKAKPDELKYGTSFGHGGVAHVPMEEFEQQAGIKMTHIPFRGDSDAIMQLVRGELEMIVAAGTAIPFVEDGRLRLVAWMTPQRHPRFNNVPTFREVGYPIEVEAPISLGGPKGMPPARVAYLQDMMERVLKDAELLAFMDRNYQRTEFKTSAELTAWAPKQFEIEVDIVKRFNLTAQ